jgi:HK97 family phage major capsid protein
VTVNTKDRQRVDALASRAKSIIDVAEAQNRGRTADEDLEIAELLKKIGVIRGAAAAQEEIHRLGREIGAPDVSYPEGSAFGRPGDVFVKSAEYRKIADPAGRASRWSSGPVEVPYRSKATLLEGELGSPGTGGALVPVDTRPGVAPILFERLTVADLIPSSPTNSNVVRSVVETVATSGAAVVPEEGEKPESTLEFSEVDVPVKKIATWIPLSDELLEDAPAIQGYINGRLTLFVRQKEEEELLHGAGGDNLLGIYPQVPSANKYVSSDADSPNSADHIYEAISVSRRSYLEPDTIVIHPDDWADLRLVKDTTENYLGGSPFGNGQPQPGESLWGLRVLVTTAAIPGSALVGAFGTGLQVFRRGGLTVEASNQHADFFIENKTAIRAELRVALHVARPESLCLADLGYAS